jgi:hypothetical protein
MGALVSNERIDRLALVATLEQVALAAPDGIERFPDTLSQAAYNVARKGSHNFGSVAQVEEMIACVYWLFSVSTECDHNELEKMGVSPVRRVKGEGSRLNRSLVELLWNLERRSKTRILEVAHGDLLWYQLHVWEEVSKWIDQTCRWGASMKQYGRALTSESDDEALPVTAEVTDLMTRLARLDQK